MGRLEGKGRRAYGGAYMRQVLTMYLMRLPLSKAPISRTIKPAVKRMEQST